MDMNRKVVELNIDDVLPNRFQPRIKFSEEAIIELSNSIKEHGVIQPIVVRPIGDKFEIIAGERRYKASCMAGLQTIPAIITDLNDKDSAEVALIENVQRENLTPIEEAISYKKILDMGYITQDALAAKLGKTQSTIANKLRLLNLDDEVQEALLREKISERHARSLLKLTDREMQKEMLRRIIEERMPVRRADEEINRIINGEYQENPGVYQENPGEYQENPGEYQENPEEYQENPEEDMNIIEEQLEAVPKDEEKPVFKFINFQPETNNTEESEKVEIQETKEEIKPGKFFSILNEDNKEPEKELEPAPIPQQNNVNINDIFAAPQNVGNNSMIDEINEIEQSINNSSRNIQPEQQYQPEELTNDYEENYDDFEDDFEQENDEMPEQQEIVEQPEMMNQPVYMSQPINNFRDVINSIRNCSNEIENAGYEIETEEFDLEEIYQVVFKIRKGN